MWDYFRLGTALYNLSSFGRLKANWYPLMEKGTWLEQTQALSQPHPSGALISPYVQYSDWMALPFLYIRMPYICVALGIYTYWDQAITGNYNESKYIAIIIPDSNMWCGVVEITWCLNNLRKKNDRKNVLSDSRNMSSMPFGF